MLIGMKVLIDISGNWKVVCWRWYDCIHKSHLTTFIASISFDRLLADDALFAGQALMLLALILLIIHGLSVVSQMIRSSRTYLRIQESLRLILKVALLCGGVRILSMQGEII